MHTYATTKELKKKRFTLKSQYMKESGCVKVTFILEIKLQKNIFSKM